MGSIQGSADRIAYPPGFRGGPQFLLCRGGSVSSRRASGRLRRPRARDRRLRRLRCIGPAKGVWAVRYLRCGNGRFSALVHLLRARKARCGRERRDARGDQSVLHCDLYRSLLVKKPRVQHIDKSAGTVTHPPSTRVSSCPFWLWSILVVCSSVGPQRYEKVISSGRNKKIYACPARQRAFVSGNRKNAFTINAGAGIRPGRGFL